MGANDNPIRLDLNNPVFQENLFGLQKPERSAAIDTLRKIRQMSWNQLYRDNGLKWEKIASVKPPPGIDASPKAADAQPTVTEISCDC
jgi:GH35 family endo-1,4-beta-xylanase